MLGSQVILTATAALILIAAFLNAAATGAQKTSVPTTAEPSVNGTWQAGGGDTGPWVLNLREDHGVVSGRLWQNGGLSDPASILDGRIAGNIVVLKYQPPAARGFRAGVTITLTGTLQKDEIAFTTQVDPAPRGGGSQNGLLSVNPPKRFKAKRGDAAIWGRATVERGLPLPALRIEFLNSKRKRFEPVQKPLTPGARPNAISAANLRQFVARLPVGEYTLAVSGLPNGYLVRSIEADGADLNGRALTIAPNSPVPELAIAIGVTTGSPWIRVEGRVANVASRVQIVTSPFQTPQQSSSPPNAVELTNSAFSEPWTAKVEPDGRFEFPQILPGVYQVRFLPDPTRKNVTTIGISAGSNRFELVAPDVNLGCLSC
ncbi:MAG TPA: hypothetical protein VFY29_20060 [Terriglobia bacterium]|nr:hypothetical protein [Terriglobia bacterium]